MNNLQKLSSDWRHLQTSCTRRPNSGTIRFFITRRIALVEPSRQHDRADHRCHPDWPAPSRVGRSAQARPARTRDSKPRVHHRQQFDHELPATVILAGLGIADGHHHRTAN